MNTSRVARLSLPALTSLVAVGVVLGPGCGGDETTTPPTTAATSSSTSSGSAGSGSGTTTSAGTPTTSSGSSTSSGAAGATTGGSAGSTAATTTTAGAGGSGGAATTGSAGSGGSGGSGGSAGTGGAGGSAGSGGGAGSGGSKDGGTPSDGGPSDGGTSEGGGGGDAGTFFFTGDFSMMGTRLCFKNGSTSNTGNRPPFINWGMVPAGTMSIVVSLRDFTNGFVHWIACNIPPATTGLPAGTAMNVTLPMGAAQSNTWFGPGAGMVDMYQYKVWAMKSAMVNCANISANAKSTLWTQLTNDEMGAKNMVLDSRAVFAYGNNNAMCQ